jgi:hypothetical protein
MMTYALVAGAALPAVPARRYLDANQFSGAIPQMFDSLTNLRELCVLCVPRSCRAHGSLRCALRVVACVHPRRAGDATAASAHLTY